MYVYGVKSIWIVSSMGVLKEPRWFRYPNPIETSVACPTLCGNPTCKIIPVQSNCVINQGGCNCLWMVFKCDIPKKPSCKRNQPVGDRWWFTPGVLSGISKAEIEAFMALGRVGVTKLARPSISPCCAMWFMMEGLVQQEGWWKPEQHPYFIPVGGA